MPGSAWQIKTQPIGSACLSGYIGKWLRRQPRAETLARGLSLLIGSTARTAREYPIGAIMSTFWARVWGTSFQWNVGNMGIVSLAPGESLVRVHFGIRFQGVTSNLQNMQALGEDFLAFGLVTISSVTGSTPPNALSAAGDANPPLERWLYWSTMQMKPRHIDGEVPGNMIWSTDDTALVADSRGQVKANVPAGQQLHVFLSWAPWFSGGWQTRGIVTGNAWASALVLT